MNVAYNMDCLEAMRQMPDNAFDLAVVDPPYGDGLGSQSVQVERERERAGTRGTDSAGGSTSTRLRFHGGSKNQKDPWNKYLKDRPLAQQLPTERERETRDGKTPTGEECQTARRNMGLCGLAEHGRRSTQKNHCVGRSAGAGIF